MTGRDFGFDVGEFIAKNDLAETVAEPPEPEPTARAASPANWSFPGFHGRARVVTNFGNLPIMGLRKGDRIKTKSGAYKKVQWTDELRLDESFLKAHPEAQPMQIAMDAFGSRYPEADFMLSSAQEFILPTAAQLMKKGAVTPLALATRNGVRRVAQPTMSYFVFHCGEEDYVCVEGVWCRVAP